MRLMPTNEARRKLFEHGSSARDFEKQVRAKNKDRLALKGKRENYSASIYLSSSLRLCVFVRKFLKWSEGEDMKRILLALLVFTLLQSVPLAQTRTPVASVALIKAGRLIDVRGGRAVENQGILLEGERIKAVGPLAEIQKNVPALARVIDLSRATVLPGLADCHTHILLQGDITATDYDEQLLKESIPY